MGPSERRRFLAATSALFVGQLARAQVDRDKTAVLGVLSPTKKGPRALRADYPVIKCLEGRGWLEGKTVRVERYYGEGSDQHLPAFAAELVSKNVDVIYAYGPEAAVAAARATTTIPIVFWAVAWPIEMGLVDSLANPGRNVTGIAWQTGPEVDGKRIELLREVVPRAKRLAVLLVPTTWPKVGGGRFERPSMEIVEQARNLGLEARTFLVSSAADFAPAFAAIEQWRADALYVGAALLMWRQRFQVLGFVRRNRIPSVHVASYWADYGGLVAYGTEQAPTFVRVCDYVDRILRGERPSALPVELPSRYELTVNLRTARELGLNIPPTLLLRADRVIE